MCVRDVRGQPDGAMGWHDPAALGRRHLQNTPAGTDELVVRVVVPVDAFLMGQGDTGGLLTVLADERHK
ncbi:hypothetical protein GCM10009612_01640 [Streptomyces beijiangensis]